MELDQLTVSVLDRLTKAGAEAACCEASNSETREFNVENGSFSLLRTLFDKGLTLTAYQGHKKGLVHANRFDEEAVAAAVADCLAVAQAGEPDEAWRLAPEAAQQTFTLGVPEPDMDLFFSRLQELLAEIAEQYPTIGVESMVALHRKNTIVYRNTNGACFHTLEGYFQVELEYVAHDGDLGSSIYYSVLTLDRLDRPLIELGSVKSDLDMVVRQVHTTPLEGKFTGTILLPPACLGDFLSSALSNFAGNNALLDGTSIWKEKLGKPVADPRITLQIAPLHPDIVCGERYTAEGFVSQDYSLIDRGVLKSFQLTDYVANKTGYPRASNTASGAYCMEPGDRTLQQIIAGIDRGVLVGRFSGGQPSANGDFSGVAKNSFLIENGVVTDALSETMISGNLDALLNHLVALSSETVRSGSTILPWAAFDGVTISGK